MARLSSVLKETDKAWLSSSGGEVSAWWAGQGGPRGKGANRSKSCLLKAG